MLPQIIVYRVVAIFVLFEMEWIVGYVTKLTFRTIRRTHLCFKRFCRWHFIYTVSFKGIKSVILTISISIQILWNHCKILKHLWLGAKTYPRTTIGRFGAYADMIESWIFDPIFKIDLNCIIIKVLILVVISERFPIFPTCCKRRPCNVQVNFWHINNSPL